MEWTNPNEVMKTHRIKRSASLPKSKSTSDVISNKHQSLNMSSGENFPVLHSSKSDAAINLHSGSKRVLKRRNPFGRDCSSPHLRKRKPVLDQLSFSFNAPSDGSHEGDSLIGVSTSYEERNSSLGSPGNQFLTELSHKELHMKTTVVDKCRYSIIPAAPERDESPSGCGGVEDPSRICEDSGQGIEITHRYPPVDWSIKRKLRIVTNTEMDDSRKYPGIDARHVHSFVHHSFETGSEWGDLNLYHKLRRCCMHYSYPQLPWISLFPRFSTDYKSRTASFLTNDVDAIKSLSDNWSTSLMSVYQQLRSGIAPFFYICCHQFTVLFRCQRSTAGTSMSALLSPSTRGLRELLTKEGITFCMPNKRVEQSSKQKTNVHKENKDDISGKENDILNTPVLSLSSHTTADDHMNSKEDKEQKDKTTLDTKIYGEKEDRLEDSEEEEDLDDHSLASRWLEGMGLNRKDFPSLEPTKVKIQSEGFRDVDNRPQSMVYVEGTDVHLFFNFLLNYSGCVASSGPQMGIPPTLLSPVPFIGGSLTINTVKHSVVKKRSVTEGSPFHHVFEVAGPILPNHLLNIASILQGYPSSSSTVTCNTHTSSAALNTSRVNDPEKDKLASGLSKILVNLSSVDFGLFDNMRDRLTDEPTLDNGSAIKELGVSPTGFTWIC